MVSGHWSIIPRGRVAVSTPDERRRLLHPAKPFGSAQTHDERYDIGTYLIPFRLLSRSRFRVSSAPPRMSTPIPVLAFSFALVSSPFAFVFVFTGLDFSTEYMRHLPHSDRFLPSRSGETSRLPSLALVQSKCSEWCGVNAERRRGRCSKRGRVGQFDGAVIVPLPDYLSHPSLSVGCCQRLGNAPVVYELARGTG